MKKLLIISNLLTLSLWLYTSCNRDMTAIQGKNCDWFCYNYSNQPLDAGIIGYDKARSLATDYQNSVSNDATCIWFDLEAVKKYIWQVENSICKTNCPKKPRLGLRMYYGRYNTSNAPQGAYVKKHTLFMVPTFDNAQNHHVDFNPFSASPNCDLNSMSIVNVVKQNPKAKIMIFDATSSSQSGSSSGSMAQNMGCLDPPGCPEGRAF
ncbi:MAG: hypothetical protein MUE30_10455 [Spirosomaceae bacterium]|jgi:hypothetical protein|nr:hypothetical protein [Spirosomataceae bacterium]